MPSPRLLHEFFEVSATHHPDRIAIDVPPGLDRPARQLVTYAALRRRSAALAAILRTRSVAMASGACAGPDSGETPIIALLLRRETPDLYAAQLAVLQSGCAYTALDPRFPDAHLAGALADAAPLAILTDAEGAARLATLGIARERLLVIADTTDADARNSDSRAEHGRDEPSATGSQTAPNTPTSPRPALQASRVESDPTQRLAYVIYTSGTTGRPKGVEITHAGIANLVASDLDRYQLTAEDRVAQCSSPAYDSSVEETWLALAAGATLVPLDDDTVRMGPDLVPWLQRERINVLCPPPTLLRATGCADPQRALPNLRLLYVGGEALSDDLAARWAAGRWMENGYGPTECTVTVVRGRVFAGRPVTIGHPVRGHAGWVVDESLEEVADGEPGELLIAGPGLARGYRGLPELTAERFPTHPRFGRVYRTGDLVRRIPAAESGDDCDGRSEAKCSGTPSGEFEYLGRLDSQIKLRGYRIELSAIESLLAACPGVRAAACTVERDGDRELLVAHVVPESREGRAAGERWEASEAERLDPALDLNALLQTLRAALPEYMVPVRIGTIGALPTTVGGKLDRRALPRLLHAPRSVLGAPREANDGAAAGALEGAADPLTRAVLAAFARAVHLDDSDRPISPTDDFFLDLGGDSLSAVGVICDLRRTAETASLTVRDLYALRTSATIAEFLRRPGTPGPARGAEHAAGCTPVASTLPCTIVQTAWILLGVVLAGVMAAATVMLLPRAFALATPELLLLLSPFVVLAAGAAWLPISVLLTLLLKRALIGRYVEGRHPFWGWYYLRHWLVVSTARLIPWSAIEGSVLMSLVLRSLGATVGRRAVIHRGVDLRHGGWDLLSLGNDVTLGQESALRLVSYSAGEMVIAPIALADGATLDVRAGVSGPATIGRNALIGPLSWLQPGSDVPAEEAWSGVPATNSGPSPAVPSLTAWRNRSSPASSAHRAWRVAALPPALHALLMLLAGALRILVPGVALVGILLGLGWWAPGQRDALVAWLASGPGEGANGMLPEVPTLLAGLGAALLGPPCMLVVLAIVLRAGGRVAPGACSAFSVEAVRIWIITGVVDRAGRWLSGSLFWPWWLRLAGMRVGRDCEISTIIDVLPATVTVGDGSFFADGIYFCSPWRHRGAIVVRRTTLGSGTFVGNHAVIPAGADYPDDLFVGVSTLADATLMRSGGDWFGMPPIALPRRQVSTAERHLTHDPGALRYANRLFWEGLRFALPVLPIVVGVAWLELLLRTAAPHSLLWWAGFVPAISLGAVAAPGLAIVALKWALLGRAAPGAHPLWSCWCSRWDFLYVAWGVWARASLAALEGTLLLNAFLRLTGVRLGRRVFLGPGFTQVVDPDMLEFETGATVTGHFQAHSFEDRILKTDRLQLRRGATVGEDAVVFYGAEIGAEAVVLPHAVVMKRDRVAAGSVCEGCPSRPRAR